MILFYFFYAIFYYFFFSVAYPRQLLKASTNPNKIFTHDFYLENLGYVRKWASQVTCDPLIGGLLPPSKLTYLRFQPIQTKFSHITFNWNSSSEFENGHHRSNATPPPTNRGFLPPRKMFVDTITLERLN